MSKSRSSATEPSPEATETLLSHLIELRDRILRIFLAVLVIFLILFPFANPIYTWMATPLMVHLQDTGHSMIAIDVAAPFLIPFKLVLLLAVVLAIPYILYQVWAFVAPGLYQHEKQLAAPLIISSTLLFYTGMAFAYFVVFPLIFAFFTATAPEGVAVMTDIARYLDFIIMLFIAFGIAFEMPVATILLVKMGLTSTEKLARKRPYVIVGTFVIGMILTPPDIISQTLLALPMWLLFEVGLVLARVMEKRQAAQRAVDPDDDDDEDPEPPPRASGLSPKPKPGSSGGAGKQQQTPRPHAQTEAAASDYRPLSTEEMDAELDRIEQEDQAAAAARRAKAAGDTGTAHGDTEASHGDTGMAHGDTEKDKR